ncbi:MAG: VWA domain-containing protein [Acidobacteria bacterium]|nr:VWA domain-containing protein [Acidobacteriota bacterium]
MPVRPCALIVLACAGACAFAQPPSPQPPEPVPSTIPTLRITVTLVQVDAVVTDSHGNHVMDLASSDFEILQDGRPQPVTFFSRVPLPPRRAAAVSPKGVPVPLTSTALTSAAQVKRAIALVVDDLALSFEDLVRTREAIRRYIESQMQPGDLVSIVRTGGGVAILEQFTTDKRVLLEAASSLKWRFSGRQGLAPVRARPGESEAPSAGHAEYLDYQYSLSALGALGTIEQVVQGMKAFPGRKSVVFFSDNLRVDGSIYSAIDHLTDLANRSEVSLYAIDPGGLRAKDLKQDPIIETRDTDSMAHFPGFPGAELYDEPARQAGMDALAGRTGGLFYHNRNDIDSCIAEAADDQLGYYLLGYSPESGTFDSEGRGRFHKVTVRVRRPGLKVRWKSGFNGVPDQLALTTSAAPKSRRQELLEAMASPFTATGIAVRLTSMYVEPKKFGPVVSSQLLFQGRDVTFTHDEDSWKTHIDVLWVAYTGVNKPMWQGEKQLDLTFTGDEYRTALRDGIVLPLNMRAPHPGTFLLRAVVRDVASHRLGSASQYVDVPDTRKGRLGLTGIALRQANAEIVKDMAAAGVRVDRDWTQGVPAIRRFRPGQGIVYGYGIVNPKRAGADRKPNVVTYVRVFRNGRLIYTGPESHAVIPSPESPSQFLCGGVLRLGEKLDPGEYLLQVVVRDANGKKKAPPLTQWIDFEVV